MPVNQSSAPPAQKPAADARLYLRDREVDEAASLVLSAARRLDALAMAGAAAQGLLGAEMAVLVDLHDNPADDVSALAARLAAPKQSLMRNLRTLEARGLVRRTTASDDRRRRIVELTEAGASLAAASVEERRRIVRQVLLSAGAEAARSVRRVLVDICAETGRR